MNIKRTFTSVFILLILATTCTSENTGESIVVVSNNDYTTDPYSLPYQEIHREFADMYSGEDLCIDLRDRIVQDMREIADSLGESSDILYQCIKACYQDWNTRPMKIPCYSEKCFYENQSIWAIAFNRVNSFDEETLEHFDVFFVSCMTFNILFYDGCF